MGQRGSVRGNEMNLVICILVLTMDLNDKRIEKIKQMFIFYPFKIGVLFWLRLLIWSKSGNKKAVKEHLSGIHCTDVNPKHRGIKI